LGAVEEDIEDAVGEAGGLEDGADGPEGAGGELGALQDAGVAACEGVGDGAEAENIWRVPRRLFSVMGIMEGEKADQGAIPRMTPYGSFSIMALLPSSPHTGMWPVELMTLPATSRNCSTAFGMLKPDAIVSEAPVSIFMYSANSSPRLANTSLAFKSMSRRWEGFILDHAGRAAWAASTAFTASSFEAEEHFQIAWWVTGLTTSKVVLVVTSSPLMSRGTTWSKASLDA